jgi:hypothetical protein
MKRISTLLELIAMQEAAERMYENPIIWVSDFRTHLGMATLDQWDADGQSIHLRWVEDPDDNSWEHSDGAAHWTPEGESL